MRFSNIAFFFLVAGILYFIQQGVLAPKPEPHPVVAGFFESPMPQGMKQGSVYIYGPTSGQGPSLDFSRKLKGELEEEGVQVSFSNLFRFSVCDDDCEAQDRADAILAWMDDAEPPFVFVQGYVASRPPLSSVMAMLGH